MSNVNQSSRSPRRSRGFQRTSKLIEPSVRKVGETRGIAENRLLTHWAEIVGQDTSAVCRPVKISYAKGGFGATLTLLTTGARAPMLEASLPLIRERVNACYGYAAISRIKITQTAPEGFSEALPEKPVRSEPDEAAHDRSAALTGEIGDEGLRTALEALGANVINKQSSRGSV